MTHGSKCKCVSCTEQRHPAVAGRLKKHFKDNPFPKQPKKDER